VAGREGDGVACGFYPAPFVRKVGVGIRGQFSSEVATSWNNIGGEFRTIGGVISPRLAALNGTTYQAVSGSPTSGRIGVLLPTTNGLYVGGNFTSVGGQTVNRVALLSANETWSALGAGIGPWTVKALSLHNGSLYAGGNFTQDGAGQPLNHMAVWSDPAALQSFSEPLITVQYCPPLLTLTAKTALQGTFTRSNSLGQALHTQPLSLSLYTPETIHLPPLPPGLYLLSLTSHNQTLLSTKIPSLAHPLLHSMR